MMSAANTYYGTRRIVDVELLPKLAASGAAAGVAGHDAAHGRFSYCASCRLGGGLLGPRGLVFQRARLQWRRVHGLLLHRGHVQLRGWLEWANLRNAVLQRPEELLGPW